MISIKELNHLIPKKTTFTVLHGLGLAKHVKANGLIFLDLAFIN